MRLTPAQAYNFAFGSDAERVALAVCRELGAVAEEQTGPEDALVSWALARPDGDPGIEALAGLLDYWAWSAVAVLGRAA